MPANRILVMACKAYGLKFGTPATVFYPGCGNDSSPSLAFPNATTFYVDPVEIGLRQIKTEFPKAIVVAQKAEDASPVAQYDLALDIQSGASLDAIIRDVRRSGHLLVGMQTSDRAFDHPQLQFIAALKATPGSIIVDTADLERYAAKDPDHPAHSRSNHRLVKAPFYLYKKLA